MVIKYFIGGYAINRTLQDRLDIKLFSPRVEKYFTSGRNTRREISCIPLVTLLSLRVTTDYSPEINFHLALGKGVGVKSSHTPWPRCIKW